jgi:hypothetical protein
MQTNEIYNRDVVADATAAAAAFREAHRALFASAMSADSMCCQNIQENLLVNEVGLVGPGTDTLPPVSSLQIQRRVSEGSQLTVNRILSPFPLPVHL